MSRGYADGYGSSSTRGPNFRWWIPADGIRRDVITADIQRYLGSEAVVKPGEGRDNDRGRSGYWIAAYRTLTPAMIQDLKADSANFARSGDTGSPLPDGFGLHNPIDPDFSLGRYEDSMTHRSRQHWQGPTAEPTAEPSRQSQPSRAESDATSYSRESGSSGYGSAQSYDRGAPAYNSGPQYDYEGYGRGVPQQQQPQREPEQRRVAPQVDEYGRPYNSGAVPAGYGQYGQAVAPNEYTHVPGSSSRSHAQPQEPNYGGQTGYAQQVPRGHEHNDYGVQPSASSARYGTGQAMPNSRTGHQTGHQNVAATRPAAPPGYYLASDGNYYPESSRPT